MRTWILALGLLAAACGEEPKRTYAEEDLRALVPVEADVVVRARSCRRLQAVLEGLGNGMQLPMAMPDIRSRLAQAAGAEPDSIVDTEPVAFAAKWHRMSPGFAFVVPAADPESVLRAKSSPHGRMRGGYVALGSFELDDLAEPCPLLAGLPAADIAVGLDVESLVTEYRGEIDSGLGMLERFWRETPFAHAVLPGYPARVRQILDSGDTLSAGFTLDGSTVRLDFAYSAREGTALAAAPRRSSLGELARFATPELYIVGLMRFEPDWLLERQSAILAELGKNGELAIPRRVLGIVRELLGGAGDEWMLGYRIDAQRLEAVAALRDPRAPAERLAVARTVLERLPDRVDLEQTSVGHRARIRLPEDAPFRELVVDVARREGVLILAVASEAGFADRVLAARPPPHLAEALARVRGELAFLGWADLRALASGIAAMSDATGQPSPFKATDGPPIPLLAYGAGEGRTFRGEVRYDPFAVAEVMREFR